MIYSKITPGSNGYSARNLWDMRGFYVRYSNNEKLRQLVAEISWGCPSEELRK
jgi:hypothetical protein